MHLSEHTSICTNLDRLAERWISAISDSLQATSGSKAIDLYKGGHWALAKNTALTFDTELWIISAGLGLLHSNDIIPNYQATFTTGNRDSIPKAGMSTSDAHQHWWYLINNYRVHGQRDILTIKDIMARYPHDRFVIAGSTPYIIAIQKDITSGINNLANPEEQVLIVTSGRNSFSDLNKFVLTSKEKMCPILKCNMLTLNISLLNHALKVSSEQNLGFPKLKQYIENQFHLLDEKIKPKRLKRTESEVISYIREILDRHSHISASCALRIFRDTGNSFEEKNFRRLFSLVKNIH